ncbi:hypothetical protein EVU96_24910 [Bacillus infantis]|uniref:hypothetical protein n=1 Tax=Bacillus infantis TaxID=324767 RepID=UPI00101D9772|nr:hypothetical protein [Bacillus infantis]RYI25209.1 hypothetical protein EVU96_24910 [Bacillus infantis]
MAVVQPILVTYLANQLSDYVERGKVKIDGDEVEFDIFKTTIEGGKVRKYLYVVEEKGNITEANLLDSNGNLLAIKPVNIQKDEDGIMIVFEFNLDVQEV